MSIERFVLLLRPNCSRRFLCSSWCFLWALLTDALVEYNPTDLFALFGLWLLAYLNETRQISKQQLLFYDALWFVYCRPLCHVWLNGFNLCPTLTLLVLMLPLFFSLPPADPHIKVCGKRENVREAKDRIMSVLDTKVRYLYHSDDGLHVCVQSSPPFLLFLTLSWCSVGPNVFHLGSPAARDTDCAQQRGTTWHSTSPNSHIPSQAMPWIAVCASRASLPWQHKKSHTGRLRCSTPWGQAIIHALWTATQNRAARDLGSVCSISYGFVTRKVVLVEQTQLRYFIIPFFFFCYVLLVAHFLNK